MKQSDAKQHEKPLKALANRRRLEIVSYLLKNREATVSDLSEHLKISFKATSKHLAVLLGADIVAKEQQGLFSLYSIATNLPPVAKKVLAAL